MDINEALDILSRSIQCDDNEAHDALSMVRTRVEAFLDMDTNEVLELREQLDKFSPPDDDEDEEEETPYFGDHDDTMPGYANPMEDN